MLGTYIDPRVPSASVYVQYDRRLISFYANSLAYGDILIVVGGPSKLLNE